MLRYPVIICYYLWVFTDSVLTQDTNSIKRLKYLLSLTDLFRHFINKRMEGDPKFRKLVNELDRASKAQKKTRGRGGRGRRKTEKEEDEELLNDNTQMATVYTESPRSSTVHYESTRCRVSTGSFRCTRTPSPAFWLTKWVWARRCRPFLFGIPSIQVRHQRTSHCHCTQKYTGQLAPRV